MSKINLKNVTCISVSSSKIVESIYALKMCNKYCDFYDTIIFTHKPVDMNYKLIEKINSKRDYDNFIVKNLPYEIDSDFCLTIQWDGFVVNPNAWDDTFFDYDYIGAPWPWINNLVGNGGFCLKSKKFLEAQKIITKDLEVDNPDDVMLSDVLRKKFETHGCKYAPPEIAYRFSTEHGNYEDNKSFGFHDLKLNSKKIKKNILTIL